MRLDDLAGVSMAALKMVALSGPVAVAMSGSGSVILALALGGDIGDDHTQGAIIVCACVLIVLGFVEWAIARRFVAHEKTEREDRNELLDTVVKQQRLDMEYMKNIVEASNTGYETISRNMERILHGVEASTTRLAEVSAKVDGIRADVDELKNWRTRIGERLGTLR
jgi:polyhydroxyalkanoate synthesis regulator phasin